MMPAQMLAFADRALHPRHVIAAWAAVVLLDLHMFLCIAPRLEDLSGGRVMFDLQMEGYSHRKALAYLAALGSEGRSFYVWRHLPVDTGFAAIEAFAIASAMLYATKPGMLAMPVRARLAFLALPALQALSDIAENLLVLAMLVTDAPGESLTGAASLATQLKWAFAALALAAAAMLVMYAVTRPMLQRKKREANDRPAP